MFLKCSLGFRDHAARLSRDYFLLRRPRASPETRELVILILGWTNGKAQVNMRDSGKDFVSATLSSLLNQHSITNYLVLTPHLINQPNRAAGTDNLCRAVLRPRGIC